MDGRMVGFSRALIAAVCALLLVAVPALAADNQRPVASPPTQSVRASVRLAAVPKIRIAWPAATDNVKVVRYELQQRTNSGPWVPVTLPTPKSLAVDVPLTPGTDTYRFRVRAFDKAGNASFWAPGTAFKVRVREESANNFVYSGKWTSTEALGASGGSVMTSAAIGALATFTFTGTGFGFATTLGPDRGRAAIFIDSQHVATVDLYSTAPLMAWVSYRANLSSGTHTIEVVVLGTKNPASTDDRVDVDAFIVLG